LYLYLEVKQHIHLLILLDKNEQEDINEEAAQAVAELSRTASKRMQEDENGEEDQGKHFR